MRILLAAVVLSACRPPPRTSEAFPQDAYVWQREWTPSVVDAVRTHRSAFQKIVVLAAEVSWPNGEPQVVYTHPDWTTLAPSPTQGAIGLALRIGPFAGPFTGIQAPTPYLIRVATQVLSEARDAGVEVSELQLDFDCAEARLNGYRAWVEAIRPKVAPVRLRITALPSWLNQSAFPALAAASDGFVLQVHSLVRPQSPDDSTPLCDPEAARSAVERAARLGQGTSFQVALPTYGYLIAFSAEGKFLGASAEGRFPSRPAGTTLRELSADPRSMAQLIADWTRDRPAAMEGVVWYRLPAETDRFNWRWPTLEKVMAGTEPIPNIQASAETAQPGLTEVILSHTGSLDYLGPAAIRIRWSEAERIGADGVLGFHAVFEGPSHVLFTNPICRLRAGDRHRIGWLRLNAPVPITLEAVAPPILEIAEPTPSDPSSASRDHSTTP